MNKSILEMSLEVNKTKSGWTWNTDKESTEKTSKSSLELKLEANKTKSDEDESFEDEYYEEDD
jgi:hypothetical protein